MVYLQLIKKHIQKSNITDRNFIVINPAEESLCDFELVRIQKSNGQWYTFNITRSDITKKGSMHLLAFVERAHRFHTNHTYWIEGFQYIAPEKNLNANVPSIGIVGQDKAIERIMWSVFEPRRFSLQTRRELNMKLTRGVVLYGPPGTGKTSIIRGLCNHLGINPRVINGPELLKRYVGDSEEAVRKIFDPVIMDQHKFSDQSPLHVIVVNEMEALFPNRSVHIGESNTSNTAVSQMLCMMDGYTQFDNFIIFGTTNRLEMIDSALLRNGRFGLKIKIDLPNEKGRFEILKYITNNLKKNARLASDVTEKELYSIAMNTINYSGADLVELSYHASLMAMKRIGKVSKIDIHGKYDTDESKVIVCLNDIVNAHRTLEYERRMEQYNNQGDAN